MEGSEGWLEGSEGQPAGSEGQLEGSGGQPAGSEGQPEGGRTDVRTYERNFSPFYRTSSPVGAAAQKTNITMNRSCVHLAISNRPSDGLIYKAAYIITCTGARD